nr:hypothetical protein [Tanacetum cinerariifolium]
MELIQLFYGEFFKLKRSVKKLEKKRKSKSSGLKRLRKGRIERKDDDNAAAKEVNAAEPTVFDDEEVTMTMAQTLIKMKAEKARILDEEYNKVQTFLNPDRDKEPTKKRVAEETLIQESFKKLKAVEVLVSEFKVEALQVKYPLIDWEIYSVGSRSYWKIIRVGGITQAYQSFKDMLKDFNREDLDDLWRFVKKIQYSSAHS